MSETSAEETSEEEESAVVVVEAEEAVVGGARSDKSLLTASAVVVGTTSVVVVSSGVTVVVVVSAAETDAGKNNCLSKASNPGAAVGTSVRSVDSVVEISVVATSSTGAAVVVGSRICLSREIKAALSSVAGACVGASAGSFVSASVVVGTDAARILFNMAARSGSVDVSTGDAVVVG